MNFTIETTIPDGNTFTCVDDTYHITLTITADSKSHTLEVVQKTGFSNVGSSFTGRYVDDDTWEGMKDQVNAAKNAASAAQTQNQWTNDYFSAPQGNDAVVPEIDDPIDYTPPVSSGTISSDNSSNSDNRDDYPIYTVAPEAPTVTPEEPTATPEEPTVVPEEPPEFYEPESEPRYWDGTYTCVSDGPDGTKTLTITQTSDSALSINLYHLYADGREDSLDIIADIGTYDNGRYFASYESRDYGKPLYFTLVDNSTVDVVHMKTYPAIDLEFHGTYTSKG